MKRTLSLCCLIATLIAAGAADLHAQNVAVDKNPLSFSALQNGPAVSQTLTVTGVNGAATPFLISSNAAYVKVNGQTGISATTPATISVSVDPTGLLPGAQPQTSLTIATGAGTLSVAINVTISTISASPSSITFSGYTAGDQDASHIPLPQSITLSGPPTAFVAVATATTGGNWFLVTPPNGTSPTTVIVALNPQILPGLAVGTYQGKVTITPSGGTTNIPVEIPVALTVSAAPVVTLAPASMQFNVQTGGTNNVTSQTLTIATSPAASLGYNASGAVEPNPAGKNWITLTPPNGSTNAQTGIAQTTISVDASNLPPNTYNGEVTISTPSGSPAQQKVPVKLVVSSTPLLNTTNSSLTFNSQFGGTAPATQSVNVTATSGVLSYTVAATTASGGNWLTAPTAGTTSAPFDVAVNPANLTPGTYQGTLTVTGAAAGTGTLQIQVTLKVTNDPVIITNFTPSNGVSFPFQIGQPAPGSQTLRITSSTGAPLSFTATPALTSCTGSNWLLLNGSAGSPVTSTTDAGSVTLSVNPAGLPAGNCTGTISIAATVTSTGVAAANSPVVIPVTLYVSNTPLLVVTPATPPTFTAAVGAQSVAPVNLTLTTTSTTPSDVLTYTATFQTNSGGSWLFVGPLSGSTATGNVLTVTVIPSLLSAGTYTGKIVVTALGPGNAAVANSPLTIPVTLTVTAGTLTLSATTANFNYMVGGTAPAAQTINIGSTGVPLTYTAVANTGSAPAFFTVTPASGTTSANTALTVTLDPSKLTAAGTYNGTITVTSPGAGNSPATINVTATVTSGTISAPTTALAFTQAAGGTAPAAQTIAVTGTPGALSFTVATGQNTPWLSVTPTTGTTPGSIQVSVSAGSMPVGQYTGSVIITSPGAVGSPITVPVTLSVTTGQTLTATPASLAFTYTIGATAPTAQTLAIASSGSAAITAQAQTTSGGSWLQVTPTSGNVPATLSVTAVPGSLTAGVYTGSISITSPSSLTPLSVPVTFTVVVIPKPVVTAIGNAASYATGSISPGQNVVIFGTGVGPAQLATGTVTNNLWSTTTGNTRVLFDGVPAPVLYASDKQTSVMVPYGVSGRPTTSIVVEYSGVQSTALTYTVAATAPGIYTLNQQGTGPGAILNQDGVTVNGPSAAAPRGNVVSVYMTGEGQTSPAGVDGLIIAPVLSALKNPVAKVTATVGGVNADVVYAGSAASLISGVMQVNLVIPPTAPTGASVPIVITVGSVTTQSGVTVAVQ